MPLDDVHVQVRDAYRRFADEQVAPGAAERDRSHRFPYDLVPKLADIGAFGLPVPAEAGGQGADTVSFVVALEEISRADQSVGALVANQVGLSALPILAFGDDEQRRRWLPRLLSGEVLGAFGLTEPGTGSDTRAIETRAEHTSGGWVLNGSKMFITNAGTDLTGFVTVAAVTASRGDGTPAAGTFVVEPDFAGFSVSPPLRKLGWHASDTRQVFLDDCLVPASSVLGDPQRGLQQFLSTLDFGRIQIATLGCGLVAAARAAAAGYARERHAFGRRIGDFQGVAFKLADMEVDLHAARSLTLNAARMRDAGLDFAHEAAVAKLHASEAAMRAAHQCLQVHGGAGYLDDSEAARLFRDAKILEIGEGTSEIQRVVISRHVMEER